MSVRGSIPDEPSSRRPFSAWLQEKLFERRIVLVTGRRDNDLAAEAAAAVMTLDATGDEPIELHLDSPDGTLESAFVLIDTLDLLHATLRAHYCGHVGGPAIGVAAAADRRPASPHTRFRLSSRRRSSRGRQMRSPRTVASNRSYSGGSTPSSQAALTIAECQFSDSFPQRFSGNIPPPAGAALVRVYGITAP